MTGTLMFSHVALNCESIDATERFYCSYFGFKRARVIPLGGDDKIVFLRQGQMCLELFKSSGASLTEGDEKDGPQGAGIRHIAFQVPDVDTFLAEASPSLTVTLGPLSFNDFIPGWRTAWLRDPDGRIVEVSQGYVDDPEMK